MTRESHSRIKDLQHSRFGKPRRGLQILDTRIGFPRPSLNVVDSISLTLMLGHILHRHLVPSKL